MGCFVLGGGSLLVLVWDLLDLWDLWDGKSCLFLVTMAVRLHGALYYFFRGLMNEHTTFFSAGRCRLAARILSILWAGFWTFFGIAQGFAEPSSNPWTYVVVYSCIVFLLIVPTVLAWRREVLGGWLLVGSGTLVGTVALVGILIGGDIDAAPAVATVLAFPLPAVLAGYLFLRAGKAR